jgi:ssDNA-binding Zn-finger/Zn-ribbon topoisomerase 1
MNRAAWIVGLLALGAMIFFLAKTANNDRREPLPPPPVPPSQPEPEFTEETIRCPDCEGYGYVMEETATRETKRKCQLCDGKGGKVLRIPTGNVRCPDCRGFGKVKRANRYLLCPRCRGRGYVREPFQPTR